MEFGVGLLGAGWAVEDEMQRRLTSTNPPRVGLIAHAPCYAAKIAAETVLAELSSIPDLSDRGIVVRLAHTAPGPRLSEAPAIRRAFVAAYGHHITTNRTTQEETPDER